MENLNYTYTRSMDNCSAGEIEKLIIVATDRIAADEAAQKYGVTLDDDWHVTFRPGLPTVEPLNKVVAAFVAPDRGPKRSAKDLYEMDPIWTSRDPYDLDDFFDHMFQPDLIPGDVESSVEVRYISHQVDDHDRCHALYTVWYMENPVGIGQCAGRGGQDYQQAYVTDEEAYHAALRHLQSLQRQTPERCHYHVLDEDTPTRVLTSFYSTPNVFRDTPGPDED
jgi:hypothetical protein